jgi:APA family basic amino acid/polyamine antiporter
LSQVLQEASKATLARTLGLRDLVLLGIGCVIGSGIFVVPGAVLRQTGGDPGPALAVWIVGGVLSLLGALTYAELGAMHPRAGGLYVYLRDTFGPLPAFLFGWTLFFVLASGSIATLAVASTAYLDRLLPLGPVERRVAPLVLIFLVTAINVRGTRQSAGVQNWGTGIKVGAILVMTAVLLWRGNGFDRAAAVWPDHVSSALLQGIGLAMVGVLWAYEGWQYLTYSAGEALDPQRTFPRAIVLGTAALIALYVMANVGYIAALGTRAVAGTDSAAADAVTQVVGPAAGKLIAAAILVSMFSAANGCVLTAPRVFFAMARDGVFFRRLGEIHPRFGTPAFAVIAGSAWAAVLAASGTFEQLLTYVVFTGWVFYGLGAASVFVYRRIAPDAERPFRVPGYPWTPLLFIASAAAIVLNTIVSQPLRAAAGLGVVCLGVPAYLVWRRSGAGRRS